MSDADRHDAAIIWDYHQIDHPLRAAEVGIVLGCNDLGVATYAAELYQQGLVPTLVFSGATSRSTAHLFPRGEAVHHAERAIELGVPTEAILIEPDATNTGQNITLSRDVLERAGIRPQKVMLICMPYMQRRAFATCRKAWPQVDVTCASTDIKFNDYVDAMGEPELILDMVVGDLQRVMEYPAKGFAIEQNVPDSVRAAYQRLIDAGYTSYLLD